MGYSGKSQSKIEIIYDDLGVALFQETSIWDDMRNDRSGILQADMIDHAHTQSYTTTRYCGDKIINMK